MSLLVELNELKTNIISTICKLKKILTGIFVRREYSDEMSQDVAML